MADDIVTRLRNYDTCHDGDVDAAADEIERLQTEVTRLRTVLTTIADDCPDCAGTGHEESDTEPCPGCLTARSALRG